MANVPKGAPKGKKSLERFEDVVVDDLTVTAVTSTTVNVSNINDGDTDATKLKGLYATANAAGSSMYVPVASAAGTERGFKIAYAPSANGGGYFDSLYVNTKTTGTATGEYRAIEAKTSVASNLAAGAIAQGVYAKINVSGASNEVAHAIGVDVLLEEEDSGTITKGTGVRVQGGDGAIHYGVDISGDYGLAALKMPSLAGGAIKADAIATAGAPAQASLSGDTGFVGLYKDSADSNAISAVFKYDGLYYHVKLTDTTDS